MTIATGIFSRFRQQRSEVQRPYRTQYSEFLKELSSGGEVDLESLEICCRELGVDERKLQSDIELQSRRIQSQVAITQAEQASLELRDVEQQIARLRAEQDAYNMRVNSELYELRNSELGLQGQLSAGHASRAWLRTNILDAELIEKIADHHNRRQSLLAELHRAEENLNSRFDGRLNAVRSARVQIPILKSFKKLDAGQQRQLREHEENLRLHEPYVLQMEAELQAIRQRFKVLDAEAEQLESEKLRA